MTIIIDDRVFRIIPVEDQYGPLQIIINDKTKEEDENFPILDIMDKVEMDVDGDGQRRLIIVERG